MSWTVLSGWPSAVVAFAAFRAALLTTRSWLALLGAAIAALLLSTSSFPIFRELSYVAIATNFAWAWLLYRERREHAFA